MLLFLICCQSFSGHTVICSVKREERRKKKEEEVRCT